MTTGAEDGGSPAPSALRRAFDWMFRSRETGKVVVVQALNIPLGVFFVAAAIRRFAGHEGTAMTAVEFVAFASIMWWAVDEMLRGVNPFRRLLGGVVATATVAGLFL